MPPGNPTSQRETDHEASSSGSALPAHQVQDHPHGHQTRKRPYLRRRGSHQEDSCRRDILSPHGHEATRVGSVHGPERAARSGPDREDVEI